MMGKSNLILVDCGDCGYAFAVNDPTKIGEIALYTCPNCGWKDDPGCFPDTNFWLENEYHRHNNASLSLLVITEAEVTSG